MALPIPLSYTYLSPSKPLFPLKCIICEAKISMDSFYVHKSVRHNNFNDDNDNSNKNKNSVVVVDKQILLWIKHVEHRQQFCLLLFGVVVAVFGVMGVCVWWLLVWFLFSIFIQVVYSHIVSCSSVFVCSSLSRSSQHLHSMFYLLLHLLDVLLFLILFLLWICWCVCVRMWYTTHG